MSDTYAQETVIEVSSWFESTGAVAAPGESATGMVSIVERSESPTLFEAL